ncbi:hypothetical protein DM02DRAFT_621352 [Periconia macrospinosa]|uniref:Peptidase A2 domain-containing protein n=1 Tax=Periconia macrospinosa TaxID=97972 RepID=A0A2V1EG54_9PLEO|nr:hypothetical protein DM02DRAFT_621352 [Periconia macrospinosa]
MCIVVTPRRRCAHGPGAVGLGCCVVRSMTESPPYMNCPGQFVTSASLPHRLRYFNNIFRLSTPIPIDKPRHQTSEVPTASTFLAPGAFLSPSLPSELTTMRNAFASLVFLPALALAAPDFVTDFQPAILEESTAQSNITVLEDGSLELLKRQQSNCAQGYSVCNNIARPDLCCRTNQICSADRAGNAACCPIGAACTGTIGVIVGPSTSISVSGTTASSQAGFATPTPTITGGGTSTTSNSFIQSSSNGASPARSTVPNSYFPFPFIPTTYTAAAACSSAYTSCQLDAASCTAALASGREGVTISAPNGGVTATAVPSLGVQSAQSICQSLSSKACYGLQVEACASFGGGSGAAPTGCVDRYKLGAGVALGTYGKKIDDGWSYLSWYICRPGVDGHGNWWEIMMTAIMLPPGPVPKLQLPTKRKRDSICGLGGHTSVFTIKPCPKAQNDRSHTFKPVRIIGRSQLPVSFLDTGADDELPSSRLFSAELPVLENRSEIQGKGGEIPRVLIARHEKKQALYAIERVQNRVYSLCKLAPWLKEKNVADLWDPEHLKAYPKFSAVEVPAISQAQWWNPATINTEPEVRPIKHVQMSMLRPRKELEITPKETDGTLQCVEKQGAVDMQPTQSPLDVDSYPPEPPAQLSPQEQLEGFAEQYLNAIYMSRTSLAYFAKGPITRIRAVFTSTEEGAPQTSELVTFLRAMLLSRKVEETKYTKKLPEIIKDIPPGWLSDDDQLESSENGKKSKKKKKVKLSREGTYPQESEIIKRWWLSEIPSGEAHGEETLEQRIKRRLADLRVREALAQMILMLEIVALEALSTSTKSLEKMDNATETQEGKESQEPPKRKKKLDDINLRLDLLLDKLCIWQSIEKDGVLDFDTNRSSDNGGMHSGHDRLQSFCIEVIVPFYTNRLPEQARTVNKKLGGPVASSPPKRKAMKPPATSSKVGGPKEPESKKSRRSLARVVTDTAGRTGERRSVSLSRSATDSALLRGIKREGSEVSLSGIPLQRSPSQAARRSMSQFRHLQGREIDLETTSAAAAAKLRQKKRVAEDLQEAITALKKPNRGLAAGSYADEIEKRGLGFANKSRKPTTTVRKVVKDVQVSATPRAVRKVPTDVIEQTPVHNRNPFFRERETGGPSSSDFCIPSSGPRPSSSVVPATVQRNATTRAPSVSVADTPTRPAASRMLFAKASAEDTIFATPAKRRALSPESPIQGPDATPTKVVVTPQMNISSTKTSRTLLATFTKCSSRNTSKPCPPEPVPVPAMEDDKKDIEEEGDIFDALGWNDDDDII